MDAHPFHLASDNVPKGSCKFDIKALRDRRSDGDHRRSVLLYHRVLWQPGGTGYLLYDKPDKRTHKFHHTLRHHAGAARIMRTVFIFIIFEGKPQSGRTVRHHKRPDPPVFQHGSSLARRTRNMLRRISNDA